VRLERGKEKRGTNRKPKAGLESPNWLNCLGGGKEGGDGGENFKPSPWKGHGERRGEKKKRVEKKRSTIKPFSLDYILGRDSWLGEKKRDRSKREEQKLLRDQVETNIRGGGKQKKKGDHQWNPV